MSALFGIAVSGKANARRTGHAPAWRAPATVALMAAVLFLALGGGSPAGADDGAGVEAPPVRVLASIEPDTATVGDRMTLRVRIERGLDVEVAAPDVEAAIAPLEILGGASLPPVERDGRVVDERVYIVAAFETGRLAVPALTFEYESAAGDTGSVRSNSTFVVIESVLPLDEEEIAPRDIKPPVELPRRIWPFVLAAAIAAALYPAYRYARRWWRRWRAAPVGVVEEPIVPPRAAHLVAFERLEALKRDDPIARGEIEGFYVRVTDIVRRYVRDRFAVDAIDMTTAELVPALVSARIESEEVDRTIAYLAHADLAKFAKLCPEVPRARGDLQEAWDLVERTRFRDEVGEENGGSDRAPTDGTPSSSAPDDVTDPAPADGTPSGSARDDATEREETA